VLGLTLVEEGDAVVGEGGLELHGLRPSVAAAADSGFVSSAGGEMLSGGGCAAPPCPRLFRVFGAPLGDFARKESFLMAPVSLMGLKFWAWLFSKWATVSINELDFEAN
jgi:hypothetical protein